MKIAVIQKCPSKLDYSRLFGLPIASVYNLSSQKVSRLLKKDVDLSPDFDPAEYDYCILIGSEALKYFSTKTSITDFTGKLVPGKKEYSSYEGFIGSISPAMLAFKPENKPVFDATVKEINRIVTGEEEETNEKDYRFYRTTKEIIKELNSILNFPSKVVALDTETSALEAREGYLLGISLSKRAHHGVYLDADEFDEKCVELLQAIVDNHDVVLHNAKFDMKFLNYHMGIDFDSREGHVHDTMIMHYVLDERQGTHGLKSLALKYTDLGDYEAELDEWKTDYIKTHGLDKDSFSYELIPWDIIKVYAAKDTDATIQLFNKFWPIIQQNAKLESVYRELHLPALHFLARMEARGVPVSAERLKAARTHLDAELDVLREKLWGFPEVKTLEEQQGSIFNPNSTQQLRVLLFDILGLTPTGKLTATGAISTDKDSLRELGEQHEIPDLILKIRNNLKLKSTYIDKLLPCINGDSRVRTGFHQVTTTSGRLSSSGRFNMQQLPSNNPLIKGCVVPPKGYKIVALDLTTAEIYYAAVLSDDKAMQQIFVDMKNDPKRYPDF